MSSHSVLRKKAAAGLLAATSISSVAAAQTESEGIDTITVTAQKREQSLQEVPISITVLDGDFINDSALRDFEDYALFVPGVSFDQSARASSDVRIRGIGLLGGSQNTYGLYLDGFELTGGTGLSTTTQLIDVGRLEVLRGPQGTAFGRNVVAGAINITSAEPSTDGVSGRVEAGVENFGGIDTRGVINLPLTETTAARISGYIQHTDGHIENIGPAGGSNDSDEYGVRLALQSEPTSKLRLRGSASWEKREQGLSNFVTDGVLRGNAIGIAAALPTLTQIGLLPPDILPLQPEGTFFPDRNDTVSLDTPSFTEIENLIAIARADYDFGPASLIWVNGYIRTAVDSQGDTDASPLNLAIDRVNSKTEFYSSELRLQSNGDNRLDWVVGLYASRDRFEGLGAQLIGGDDAALLTGGLIADNVPFDSDFSISSRDSLAAFADLDFELTDRLTVLLGGRYNYDSLESEVTDRITLFGPRDDIPRTTTDDDAVTWRASLVYQLSDDINSYATVSTGYRAGGLQLGNLNRRSFGTETMTNYEVGVKAFLFDRRASINVAGFLMEWEDVQIAVTDFATLTRFTDNAGAAEALGFEVDAQINPIDGLNLFVGAAFVDTELTDVSGDPNDPRSGSPLPLAPKWTVSATADYQRSISGNLEGFIRASYLYNGEMFDDLLTQGEESLFYPAYSRIDLRAGIQYADDWRLEGFVENIENDIYAAGQDVVAISLTGSAIVTQPRRYGMRFIKEF